MAAKREAMTEVTENIRYNVKRAKIEPKSEQDDAKRVFDPIHYMGKTEYDLDEIFGEVDNGKYYFTLRSLCPGMAKTILKYKSVIFNHLGGKCNFASVQTIGRAEAFDFDDDLPLCVQIVIQVKSNSKKEFITQALKDLGFFGKNKRSPLFCSRERSERNRSSWRLWDCEYGCFKVVERPRDCLFDKGAHCHYLQTSDLKYSYSAKY